jgi:erythromycin esterase-like protein
MRPIFSPFLFLSLCLFIMTSFPANGIWNDDTPVFNAPVDHHTSKSPDTKALAETSAILPSNDAPFVPDSSRYETIVSNHSLLNDVLQDMCDRKIIMFGENGHGDGNSPAFKTALAKRLIKECGFDTLLFEASFYDGMKVLQNALSGEPFTEEMVKSSMSSIRYNSKGLAPLIPFVTEQVRAGKLWFGGVDDQISILGSFYGLSGMAHDLAAYLPPNGQSGGNQTEKGQSTINRMMNHSECHAIVKQRFSYEYTENTPYVSEGRKPILACLTAIKNIIETKTEPTRRDGKFLAMINSIERKLSREFQNHTPAYFLRDSSMFENFNWISENQPATSKYIIWTENSHAAKSTDSSKSFKGGKNLGVYIAEKYGKDHVYALAFTAPEGTYRLGRGMMDIPPVPENSLERQALTENTGLQGNTRDAVYINKMQLANYGHTPSNIHIHQPSSGDWSKAFDGIVIFRQGKPTEPIE